MFSKLSCDMMVIFFTVLPVCSYLTVVMASLTFHRTGWLDRVVQFYSNNFVEDFKKLPLVPIKATLQPAPPNYVDSPNWNYSSVIWLLTLLEESSETLQVRRAIRRSMQGSRRFMSVANSLKMFPSLNNGEHDLYYDMSYEVPPLSPTDEDSSYNGTIIYVANPVEARLPSARISVKLLREILENRANAARYMPSTFKDIYTWDAFDKKNKSTTGPGASKTTQDSTSADTGGTTQAGQAETDQASDAPS